MVVEQEDRSHTSHYTDDYVELLDSVRKDFPYVISFEDSFAADRFREKYEKDFFIHQVDEFLFFSDKNEHLAAIILL